MNDVPPTVTLGGASTAAEGSVYELSIGFNDPGTGDGDITFYVDWGDGTPTEEISSAGQSTPITVEHTFADDSDATTISVIAEDDKGTYSPVTKVVQVSNVAPVISNLAAANVSGLTPIVEGDTVSLIGDIFDAGLLDGFTLSVNWGDGSAAETFDIDAGTFNFDVVHTYVDDGIYTIAATLTDDDNGVSNTATVNVTVTNGAPTVVYTFNPTIADEGETITLSGIITDPGVLDEHTVTIDWGDDTATETATLVGRSFSATHIYEDDNPTTTPSDDYDITVTVNETTVPTSTKFDVQTITIDNAEPTLLFVETDASSIATRKAVNDTVTLTATFADPAGTADEYTATIDWGDGQTTATGTYDATTGVGTITATRQYAVEDIYDIQMFLVDDDSGTSETQTTRAVVGDFTNSSPTIAAQTFSVAENSLTGTIVGTVAAVDDGDLTYELTELPTLLSLTATSDGPADGKWTEDVSLTFEFDTNTGAAPATTTTVIELLLSAADLADNTSLADLASDLNTRFAAAGIGTHLQAFTGTDINGTNIGGKLSIGGIDETVIRLNLTGGESLGFETSQNAGKGDPVAPAEFSIDPTTGQITVNQESLNAEAIPSYKLQAKVTDFWGETATATITINLTDVNEFTPHLQLTAAVYTIDEFSPVGTLIDTIEATDRDFADVVTFSLDPTTSPFAIDASTGALTVADSAALDFDRNPQFEITVVATDQGGLTAERNIVINLLEVAVTPSVVGRHIFYNNSAFDGGNAEANAADDGAIASSTDTQPALGKTALMPGATAAFQNYTSFDRGINGIMIDIEGATDAAAISAADFEFRIGNSDSPDSWALAPTPEEVTVRVGAGENGSDRVTIIWADNAIENTWLQVIVKATTNTGIATPDVHYWGNAVGEVGDSSTHARVNTNDVILTRDNPHSFLQPASIEDAYDFNRDGRVNTADTIIARDNPTSFLTALSLITPQSGSGSQTSTLRVSTTAAPLQALAPMPAPSANPIDAFFEGLAREEDGTIDFAAFLEAVARETAVNRRF